MRDQDRNEAHQEEVSILSNVVARATVAQDYETAREATHALFSILNTKGDE